jgi:hypothetical protein
VSASSGSIDSVRIASLDPEVNEKLRQRAARHGRSILAAVLCSCGPAAPGGVYDQLVGQGDAKSRAAAVTRALELDRRRRIAERDAAIYTSGKDSDMDRLAAWVAKNVDLSDLD